jgi:hypothetical protein
LQFFSGFCLNGEERLFDEFLPGHGSFVAGFSYGAIAALKHALAHENTKRLLLLSPAYYTHKDEEFRRAQLDAFDTDTALYRLKLLKKSGLSLEEGDRYGVDGSKEQLEELLYFDWASAGLDTLVERGVKIEVFIGAADRVVEPVPSAEFFKKFGALYYLENKNHVLR